MPLISEKSHQCERKRQVPGEETSPCINVAPSVAQQII